MNKVTYDARVGEAWCEQCGAAFATAEFENAKQHDETACEEEPRE